MPELTGATALQLILALGLLNVWLFRAKVATPYRGGGAQSLREEFRAYGLPHWFFVLVGSLKLGSALALIAGMWFPVLTPVAAVVVLALMCGALAMHMKVGDAALKSLPAFMMLLVSATLVVTS
ncbi:MAG: DoxX family protein [Planctomycetes bacterium]|nr:DoxX family protein [Planctomycetota bacterium]MCB9902879.1 DoxX family protein [Planctomycetota bacterium]